MKIYWLISLVLLVLGFLFTPIFPMQFVIYDNRLYDEKKTNAENLEILHKQKDRFFLCLRPHLGRVFNRTFYEFYKDGWRNMGAFKEKEDVINFITKGTDHKERRLSIT